MFLNKKAFLSLEILFHEYNEVKSLFYCQRALDKAIQRQKLNKIDYDSNLIIKKLISDQMKHFTHIDLKNYSRNLIDLSLYMQPFYLSDNLISLNVSNTTISEAVAKSLTTFFQYNYSLQRFIARKTKISNYSLKTLISAIASSFYFNEMEVVNISDNFVYDKDPELIGMGYLNHLVAKNKLKEIYLQNLCLLPECKAKIFDVQINLSNLRILNLSNNEINKNIQEFNKFLGMTCNLEELYLTNNGLTDDHFDKLTNIHTGLARLEILDLSANYLTFENAQHLSEAMYTVNNNKDASLTRKKLSKRAGFLRSLESGVEQVERHFKLVLDRNSLGDLGVENIIENILKGNLKIKLFLSFSNCSLGSKALYALENFLRLSESCIGLDISANNIEKIDATFWDSVMESHVIDLSVHNNRLDLETMYDLVKLTIRKGS